MDVLLAYVCTMDMPGPLRGSRCPCGKLSTEPGSFTQTSSVPGVVQHWEGREGAAEASLGCVGGPDSKTTEDKQVPSTSRLSFESYICHL